jgi:uncharacterized protein (DUF1697 family)
MKKYAAFLRGINVGNIRIKMADLTLAFESLGFKGVKTFLQSGNVVFEAKESLAEIKVLLEQKLTETFHYQAFVLLYDFDDLAKIIATNQIERGEKHHVYIIFIETEGTFEELKTIAKTSEETTQEGDGVLYWKVTKGETLETPFSKTLAKAKYKSTTTVRNINTLEKMVV